MSSRWAQLAILFTVRLAMAFQFQAVAALGPLMMNSYQATLADLGMLIGLYLMPGIVFAIPGGAIGQRFGDARMVGAGLAMMLIGATLVWFVPTWEAQIAGRLCAGAGGVILNVLMSKMVTDLFAGREIATAMGIFVNSWPVGIALALVVLPPVADAAGLSAAFGVTLAAVVAGMLLFVVAVPLPAPERHAQGVTAAWPTGVALAGIVMAGSIWGLYNAALAMVFGFGPALLVERGWALGPASSAVSVVLWLAALTVPAGGIVADRLRRNDLVLVLGVIGFAAAFALVLLFGNSVLPFIAMGLVGGLSAGPIMALPARVLSPETRAPGMGIYFTMFYVMVVAAPMLAGILSDILGSAQAAFGLGIAMLAACLLLLSGVRRCARGLERQT